MRKLKLELLVLQPSALETLRRLGVEVAKLGRAERDALRAKGKREKNAAQRKVEEANHDVIAWACVLTSLTTNLENSDARILTQD